MYELIFCTCPDHQSAENIAHLLVTERLAACVNILPGVRSIYEWQGQIESAQEHLLLIKSQKALYAEIELAIKAAHPYEIPEIIAARIDSGSTEYLQWIDSCLSSQ